MRFAGGHSPSGIFNLASVSVLSILFLALALSIDGMFRYRLHIETVFVHRPIELGMLVTIC